MEPDRFTTYIAIGVIACGIAAITGPSPALLTLFQIVLVVEAVNLIGAPGDEIRRTDGASGNSQGE